MTVYLADKYYFMDRHVSVVERYGMVKERFSANPGSVAAITRREQVGLAVESLFAAVAGEQAFALVARATEHPHDVRLRELLANDAWARPF